MYAPEKFLEKVKKQLTSRKVSASIKHIKHVGLISDCF